MTISIALIPGCQYETKDSTVAPLIKHYGIVHKSVQKYLQGQKAGHYVHSEAKAGSSKPTGTTTVYSSSATPSPIQLEMKSPKPPTPAPPIVNGLNGNDGTGSGATVVETTMSNSALKVKCPFCDLMFAARYTFHQHLCDRHYKEALAEQVPSQPPYLCPVVGCGYVAKDSRQSLVRHYGMTHKVIVELLKKHAPEYVDDQAFSDHQNKQQVIQVQQVQHQMSPQLLVQTVMTNAGPPSSQGSNHFYQPTQQYQEYYPQQQQQQQQQQQHSEQYQYQAAGAPGGQAGGLPSQHQVCSADLNFEPQIDGTFDPSHYSDASSLDGFKSLPTTPVKHQTDPGLLNLATTNLELDPIINNLQTGLINPVKPETMDSGAPKSVAAAAPSFQPRSGPKICEICGKHFDGKNRAMLRVQHMAQHFKDKLFADLIDKNPPFRCPVEGCPYQTKHKPDWARHYGSVHHLIAKYLKEYLETHEAKTEPEVDAVEPEMDLSNTGTSCGNGDDAMEDIDEKTYTAYLPKADLSMILNTAMVQQSQPQRNFGVITITANGDELPGMEQQQQQQPLDQALKQEMMDPMDIKPEMVDRDLSRSTSALGSNDPEQLEPQQCFICPNGPWFKNEKELNDHLSTQHIEFVQELKPRLEVLDDLGEVLNDLDIDQPINDHQPPLAALPQTKLPTPALTGSSNSATSGAATSAMMPSAMVSQSRSTGRPCELCGFEPKTKNKSRERQDHLAMKHYRDRIQADLTASTNFSCPMCEYVGKDKQTIYRHYTGKHKVVEQYLSDDIREGRVETLAQKQAKEAARAAAADSIVALHHNHPASAAPLAHSVTSEVAGMQQQTTTTAVSATMKTLPSFEATTLELQNNPLVANEAVVNGTGIDLRLHGLVDGATASNHAININDFLEGHGEAVTADRIMQVDGMSGHVPGGIGLQVDGANDDLDEFNAACDDLTGDHDGDPFNTSGNSTNGVQGRVGAGSTPQTQMDSKCPLCDYPTKLHKTYHMATKHFRDRLVKILPKEKPFTCPECQEYEAKTRINLWTHYLGKHQYSKKWTNELLGRTSSSSPPPQTQAATSYAQQPTTTPSSGGAIAPNTDSNGFQTLVLDSTEVKTEMKSVVDEFSTAEFTPVGQTVTLPTPNLPAIEDIIKAEMIKTDADIKPDVKAEPRVEQSLPSAFIASLPGSAAFKPETITPKSENKAPRRSQPQLEYWCDLCQKVVSREAKGPHYATVHFEARLKATLPTSEPFLCPLCAYVAKDYTKLCSHFLNKHDFLDEWIRDELEVMEDEAIGKISNTFFLAPDEADLEEIDSDEEDVESTELFRHSQASTDLTSMISKLYCPEKSPTPELENESQRPLHSIRKKRKISKSVRDRGLEAVKDMHEPLPPLDDLPPELRYRHVYQTSFRSSREPIPVRIMTSTMTSKMYPNVPHEWMCHGKLLMLTDPSHENNIKMFQDQWIRGQPVIVANVHKELNMDLWIPSAFSAEFGHLEHPVVNTKTGKSIVVKLKSFWDGFENLSLRLTEPETGLPMLLKLKDWPADNDLSHYLPTRFADLMKHLPLKEYTQREGRYNLASFMPDFFARPDLGPKMYIAYGNALYPHTGTTNLHIDMSDACNVIVYVGIPNDGDREAHIGEGLKSVEEADCDPVLKARVRRVNPVVGAIWHIFHPRDADKIRDFLNKVSLEKGLKLEPNTDPIHDQLHYLDSKLRKRLYVEYGVEGYAYPQCAGDVVFIPAGAPHQVIIFFEIFVLFSTFNKIMA